MSANLLNSAREGLLIATKTRKSYSEGWYDCLLQCLMLPEINQKHCDCYSDITQNRIHDLEYKEMYTTSTKKCTQVTLMLLQMTD